MPVALRLFRPEDDGSPSQPPRADDGSMDAAGPLTVQQVIDAYLRHLRARAAADDYSADGLDNAQRDLERFAERHGARAVADCRRNDLSEWLLANPQWLSNHTKRRVLAVLVACFAWAAEESGLIPASPYRKPKSLRLPVRPRREGSPKEYVSLMRHGSRPLRRMLYFLHRSGCRPCEAREADFADVHFDVGVMQIWRHKTHRLTGEPRLIGLDRGVLRFLRNLRRRQGDGKVFRNARGKPWDRHTFARNLRRTAERIGLDQGVEKRVSAYCFRHTVVGEMVDLKFGERQIADAAGHANTRLVSWYSHNREKSESLRRVADERRTRKRQR